jgi:ankyrin repeat protein/AraC-like DNA-binding protein
MFLNHGKPAPEYITRLIMELAPLPFDQAKINKLHALIDSYQPEGTLSQALDLQVQYALQQQADHNDPCVLEIVKVLLGNGACVDSNNAGVLCHAVASGHAPIFELLMAESPKPQSLAAALPYALALPDLTGRVMMVNKLVASGALPKVVNDLLMDRIQQDPTDMAVLDALAVGAKDVQGQAIMVAIRNHLPDVVNLLIHRTSPTPLILDAALKEALAEEDQLVRFNVCTLLVLAGATEDTISDSLATAATDGDMGLAQMLIERGADPEFNHGAAIVEAARNGLVDMLHLLLDSREEFESDVLEAAFTAATEIENRDIKALLFGPLLEMGLEGPTIDAQLAYTVREGDEAAPLVQILLEGGADPNHNNGEPVVEAINNGHDRLLDMMLGAEELEEEVKELSQATLVNAIGAAWQLEPEDRLEILGKIFDIEIDACPELDAYLNMAVNEEQPENALVELLLENGADPTANQCQTLLQASVRYNHTILSMLLDRDMAPEHLAYVFSHAFGREAAAQWFHEAGLHTAQVLLERGAEGAGPSDALVAVTEAANDENFELADHFVTALLGHGADADHEDGEAIVEAASKAIAPWVHDFLQHDPAVESVSRAFAHIFDEAFPEEADALELVQPFYEWACHAEENHIDFEAVREEREPDEEEDDEEHEEQPPSLLIRGLTLYPGSFEIFHILIELGCNPEETAPCHVNADVEEEEEVSLLVFVLAQPALQVQSQIVHLLLQRGGEFYPGDVGVTLCVCVSVC